MSDDKIARTVTDAAYNHLQVFSEPVHLWPSALRERIPAFEDLYVDDPERGGVLKRLEMALLQTDAPVKLLLTGQKGSGKSWGLERLAHLAEPRRQVVTISATDTGGVTVPNVEAAEVLLLINEAVAKRLGSDLALPGTAGAALNRWIDALRARSTVLRLPDNTADLSVNLNAGFATLSARMRSDGETRRLLREVGPADLVLVANALLTRLAAQGLPVLLLIDDLDKVDPDSTRRLLVEQYAHLAKLEAQMVLTYPFSLGMGNDLPQQKYVLRNVKVFDDRGTAVVRREALTRFTDILSRLVALDLVDGLAVEEAVKNSGGIIREFGRVVRRAFEEAALAGDPAVTADHARAAIRDLRIEMERATSDGARRESLAAVRATRRLTTSTDRQLLNENMVIEYENGHPWYDVHPLIAEVVDGWAKPGA